MSATFLLPALFFCTLFLLWKATIILMTAYGRGTINELRHNISWEKPHSNTRLSRRRTYIHTNIGASFVLFIFFARKQQYRHKHYHQALASSSIIIGFGGGQHRSQDKQHGLGKHSHTHIILGASLPKASLYQHYWHHHLAPSLHGGQLELSGEKERTVLTQFACSYSWRAAAKLKFGERV